MDVARDRTSLIHGFKSVDHGDDEGRSFTPPPSPPPSERSAITSPPYWVQSHKRGVSQVSVDFVLHGGITLHDNTTGYSDSNDACWEKSVTIDEHAVVNGSRTGIGACSSKKTTTAEQAAAKRKTYLKKNRKAAYKCRMKKKK
ncbi:hypothetical protein V501_03802 [Pseudogymnoascus sp. VKM F-4519 (FW-2642)]|nr:hypothetical protein V501_03802 [Pseudogymnoascus sp. VKM F-4519 (FW-2642)]